MKLVAAVNKGLPKNAAQGDKLAWKKNALRHCYISYRVAECADVARVADEGGNSPAIIKANYLKRVKPEQAKAWFASFRHGRNWGTPQFQVGESPTGPTSGQVATVATRATAVSDRWSASQHQRNRGKQIRPGYSLPSLPVGFRRWSLRPPVGAFLKRASFQRRKFPQWPGQRASRVGDGRRPAREEPDHRVGDGRRPPFCQNRPPENWAVWKNGAVSCIN